MQPRPLSGSLEGAVPSLAVLGDTLTIGFSLALVGCSGRPKSGPPNSLGLTIRTDAYDRGALANFLIERSPNGYQVRGGDALFRSLPDLVMYYSMSAKAPLNIKLAGDTFHDDGLGLGLDEVLELHAVSDVCVWISYVCVCVCVCVCVYALASHF
jgi:hypothetical protein